MGIALRVIIYTKYVEPSIFKQYTAVNCDTVIDKFTVTNVSNATETLSVSLVRAGDAHDSSNLIIDERSIAPGICYTCPELVGHVLSNGDFISTIASASNALTIRASGREVTS